ncbi:hypothetical protein V6Z11_A09G117400 [Gossypium hirsutum]
MHGSPCHSSLFMLYVCLMDMIASTMIESRMNKQIQVLLANHIFLKKKRKRYQLMRGSRKWELFKLVKLKRIKDWRKGRVHCCSTSNSKSNFPFNFVETYGQWLQVSTLYTIQSYAYFSYFIFKLLNFSKVEVDIIFIVRIERERACQGIGWLDSCSQHLSR